jgi:formate dehydrogenase iron-sulfur subunit
MCFDRQSQGEDTACAEACSYGATMCGTREELLEEARSRLEEDPDDYYQHIYGEHEVGGTSVLFLSPFPVEELGFDPKLGTAPMPTYTWRVLEKIPGVAITAGATMCALWWLTNRRNDVRDHEAREKLEKKAAAAAKRNGSSHEENGHG